MLAIISTFNREMKIILSILTLLVVYIDLCNCSRQKTSGHSDSDAYISDHIPSIFAGIRRITKNFDDINDEYSSLGDEWSDEENPFQLSDESSSEYNESERSVNLGLTDEEDSSIDTEGGDTDILDRIDDDDEDVEFISPVTIALHKDETDEKILSIIAGIDWSKDKSSGVYSPLLFSLRKERPTISKELIEKGINIDIVDYRHGSRAPLHYAVEKGYLDVANSLIDKGADVNSRMTCDVTPLHIASKIRNKELVQMLTEKHADKKAVNYFGNTALMIAERRGYRDIASLINSHLDEPDLINQRELTTNESFVINKAAKSPKATLGSIIDCVSETSKITNAPPSDQLVTRIVVERKESYDTVETHVSNITQTLPVIDEQSAVKVEKIGMLGGRTTRYIRIHENGYQESKSTEFNPRELNFYKIKGISKSDPSDFSLFSKKYPIEVTRIPNQSSSDTTRHREKISYYFDSEVIRDEWLLKFKQIITSNSDD